MNFNKAFGKNPSGTSLDKILRSKNYKAGNFINFSKTSLMADDASMMKNIWKFVNKHKDTAPPAILPSVKTDLKSLQSIQPVIVWFGHSSYFISVSNKNILVDPVFSGNASPFSFGAKSFKGSDVYAANDFPEIDLLIITHDHYDHLDYRTVVELKPKIKNVVTSIGAGSHLRYWGFDSSRIQELDWWESTTIIDDLNITAAPARHFSGRSLNRNKTLWSSFILQTGNIKFYIGGDSGYDTHFKEIGHKFGPFDIALLEAGQYNPDWRQIHMMPEETVQAAIDLKAKVLMPVHWAKFSLAFHPWDEPIKRVVAKAKELNLTVTTPMIGEPVYLGQQLPQNSWWEILS